MSDWSRPLTTLADAERYFRGMGCSHFHMAREYPKRYGEYRALAVPDDVEQEWMKAEFEDSFKSVAEGKHDGPLWAAYGHVARLATQLGGAGPLGELLRLTEALPGRLPAAAMILVAEELVGRGPLLRAPGGPIAAAAKLGERALARRFVDLVPVFCEGGGAPRQGPPFEQRRASVMSRLRALRLRAVLGV